MHSVVTEEDEAFVAAFHTGQIANQQFHHRDHLRLAWVLIHRHGVERASQQITNAIRHFAAHHGAVDKYNDTMTRFWVWAVDHAVGRHPKLGFEALMVAEPHLLDKSLPFRHWSRELMNSAPAKQAWAEPDLQHLP